MSSLLTGRRRPAAWLFALIVAGACTAGADRILGPKLGPDDRAMADGVPSSPATGVVISQIYGGGGNSGSTYRNDFIELYNGGTTPVDLTGWSVQYASTSGTSWTNKTNLTSVILAPGQYYLVQEAAGSGGTVSLPTPDASGSISMAAGAGKVALVRSTTALSGACPKTDLSVVDFVGYGTGTNCYLGSGPTATINASTAALRAFNGQQDSHDNAADFSVGAPNPRNTSSTTLPPVDVLVATIAPVKPSALVGATVAFTVTAVKTGAPVVVTPTWSSSNSAVATIDPTTGVATAVASGSTIIRASVTSGAGETAQDTTTLSVSAPATAAPIVISQVYGGGGNSGSTLKNDFIELYNAGTTPVDLAGWSVQYSSATLNGWSTTTKTDLSGTIQPGHYFLVQEAAGTGGSVSLPTPDLVGTIAIGAASGKIALVRSTTLLSGNCPRADQFVVDFIGFGTADCFEGTAAASLLSNTTAALRKDYGRVDTNDNAADFEVDLPTPRNSSVAAPVVGPVATVTLSPATWSLTVGQSKNFIATARDADGNKVSSTFTWTTDAAAIATVDASGVATGKAPGTTKIHATLGDKSAEASITVTPVAGTINIQSRTNPLPVGFQTQLFLSSGIDTHGTTLTNADLTWSSESPSIVSVNPNTGVVTALGVGSGVIRATSKTDGVSTGTTTIVTSNPATAAGARTGHNTELGVPSDADPSDDIIIARRQYTTSYNPRRGVTNWVSWNLDATHTGSVLRCNCFTADTALVRLGLPAYETSDWINNGTNGQYSRGHMSPSADWQVSDGDNAPTFFLTNMLPQNQDMNGGPWGAFENYLRTRAVGSTEIYIVSGGIFTKDRRGPGVDGFGTISNNGKIAIPDSIWKVAVIVPDARGIDGITGPADVEVIAINTPNESPAGGATYSTYYTTVDKIQKSTGYDLLGALPENIQCRLESRNCAPTAHITGAGLSGGTEGQSLHFDASTSSDADGTVQQYQWSIDGTVVGSGSTLDHVFADNGSYEVRLVVTDNGGGTDVTTSSVSVANVAPSIGALAGGTVNEGSAFTAAGSFADPGDDSWNATVDYGDGSGVQPLTLAGKGFSLAHSYANNGSYTITVTVTETDAEGASGSQSTTVTVTNVAPVVAAFNGATILRGETYASSGTFADPGADVWSATVNYGDGSAASALALTGNAFTLQHTYSVAGVQTVTVTVSDTDGGSGTRTAQVTVLSSGQATTTLASMVSALASAGAMEDGDAKWLANKLDVAGKELARGNDVAARNQIQQAIERIEAAQRAGRLSSTDAETLTAYATRILASMA